MLKFLLNIISILLLFYSISLKAQTPTADCSKSSTAEIPYSGCTGQFVDFNTGFTLGSPGTSSCPVDGGNNDGWGWFTAGSTSTTVYYSTTSGDPMIFVYSGTCGGVLTQQACVDVGTTGDDESLTFATTVGSVYFVRIVHYASSSNVTGRILVGGLTNNECSGATAITVNGSTVDGCVTNATQSLAACTGSSAKDVWFRFVATTSTADITVKSNSGFDPVIQTYSGSCGSLVNLGCKDAGSPGVTEVQNLTGLTAGNTYYIRVFDYNGGNTDDDFVIGVQTLESNACASAKVITPGVSCVYGLTAFSQSTKSATQDLAGCSGNADDDVWYRFTAGKSTNTIYVKGIGGSGFDPVVEVFSGSCGSLSSISCRNSNSGTDETLRVTSYNPGQTYYFRVYDKNAGYPSVGSSFDVCLLEERPNPTDCPGAIAVCGSSVFKGNSSGYGTQELNGTNKGCNTNLEIQSSWYYFKTASTGSVDFAITPQIASDDYDFAVYGPLNSFDCSTALASPPFRCSYSLTDGVTGLKDGATDLTEGSGGDKWVEDIVATSSKVYIVMINNFSATTNPYAIVFGGSALLDCSILPVELSYFDGLVLDQRNQILWETISEKNASHFILEKSKNGLHFKEIAKVKAFGNSSEIRKYSAFDNDPFDVTYYRLKQVDYDGVIDVGTTISLKRKKSNSLGELSVYPNPVKDKFIMVIPSATKEEVKSNVIIYNVQGVEVYNRYHELIEGLNNITIDLTNNTAGVYFVKVIDDLGSVTSTKIIKK
jgi:hypothetical protein